MEPWPVTETVVVRVAPANSAGEFFLPLPGGFVFKGLPSKNPRVILDEKLGLVERQ